jgi:ATP-dependent Lon protease
MVTRNDPTRRWWRRADPDLARQAAFVRRMAMQVAPPSAPMEMRREFFRSSELSARMEWAQRLRGEAKAMVRARLERARSLGDHRMVAIAPTSDKLMELLANFPNFEPAIRQVQRQLSLCQCTPGRLLQLQPMLIEGAPGIGKTAFANELAKALGVALTRVNVSTLSANFSLAGLDASYESAKPGLIWDALDSPCMSPIVMLDEIDKTPPSSASALGCLYALLERHTARQFCDEALRLPVDASYVVWIATCNDASLVEPALRSRFAITAVQAPTPDQMPAVVASVHKQLLQGRDWASAFDTRLSADVVAKLADMTPRQMHRALEQAYAAAANAGRDRLCADDIPRPVADSKRRLGFLN